MFHYILILSIRSILHVITLSNRNPRASSIDFIMDAPPPPAADHVPPPAAREVRLLPMREVPASFTNRGIGHEVTQIFEARITLHDRVDHKIKEVQRAAVHVAPENGGEVVGLIVDARFCIENDKMIRETHVDTETRMQSLFDCISSSGTIDDEAKKIQGDIKRAMSHLTHLVDVQKTSIVSVQKTYANLLSIHLQWRNATKAAAGAAADNMHKGAVEAACAARDAEMQRIVEKHAADVKHADDVRDAAKKAADDLDARRVAELTAAKGEVHVMPGAAGGGVPAAVVAAPARVVGGGGKGVAKSEGKV
jgi:hypothetical protein